ncbi:MAG TPA: glycosyltransferase [Anaeromyxobacter sp.]
MSQRTAEDAGRSPAAVALVVPCYDEARRLDRAEFARLARQRPDIAIRFVDDGSRDGTGQVLDALRAEAPGRVEVLRLERNRGKAEAVRAGLLAALAEGFQLVGFCDADLSTPVDELVRLVDVARASPAKVVLASRVLLLGRRIERRAARHYLGRVFATAASIALDLPVYDTQCGAKLFRATPALARALAAPFRTRWVFDVELLARLLHGGGGEPLSAADVVEEPLLAWRDARGSKMSPWAMLRAGAQVLLLIVRLRSGGSPW